MRKRVLSLVLVSSISISLLSGCRKNSDELTMDDYIALYNQDEALIEQYGEHWLKIYSYGFAYSTEKCQQLVNAIFNQE